jgi:hypothetical protein
MEIMALLKICTSCNIEKNLSEYYRDYSIVNSKGYRSKCKDCVKIASKKRKINQKNQEKTEKKCNVCNNIKTIENFFKSTRHSDGYFAHCKICHNNKLKNKGSNEKIKRTPEYMKQYWKNRSNNIQYRMKQNIKRYISSCIKNSYKKNFRTTKYIGCSIEFFIKWIEFRFDSNMTWANYGLYWELDHVIPCASFDFSNEEEIMICFSWTNYQPLHKDENRRKSNKIITKYYEQQKNAIINFISFYKNDINYINNLFILNVRLPEVKALLYS